MVDKKTPSGGPEDTADRSKPDSHLPPSGKASSGKPGVTQQDNPPQEKDAGSVVNLRNSKESDDADIDDHDGVTFEVVEGEELEGGKKIRRKGVYLLPNLFTTGALFSGFYAIVAAMNGVYEHAASAIFVAMILDGLDGRVARMTNTQSEFGEQYDSLSDCISFGVAPALVCYSWSLSTLGKFGWMIAFVYAACAALRLARFNVQIDTADKRYFTGLPSPAAAGVVAGIVWFGTNQQVDVADSTISFLVAAFTAFSAVMMVSNVKYNSFKQLDFKGRVPFIAILAVVLVLAVISTYPSGMLLAIFLIYALSGPLLSFWRKKPAKV
ncbi:CDP-diacylglycerol--serine O-phosphatidyltransferase [Ketobacter sp. MCCC 1A13808]|uniref:CDP-diacylglycerol--serine O-phosphatidyltransferase n=1 Tax=Ketobacter sp. MCCC 1A13808 TaxID=2602738 RepID=UPI000F21847B|nr:CDP-diacylglycerol--serine O-phosphatidyltransferase [Ketobacter sp. MCCC 1A13808]MVF14759.1 CDP-diacylglycerol--serine O-phosphatidyltransferase [Ketobacter sp. MCCC 1A13808]RLP52663.1 MAG: CDP-diacylglycerol--serine O-phosphatidyltransferase [Ketobacter sp.]